jgi:hypothetical protein
MPSRSATPAPDGFSRGLAGPAAAVGSVLLRYRERARVLVRGPVTGRGYEFSAEQPMQSVHPRDAEMLLRTRQFVRA